VTISPPPIRDVIADQNGLARVSWLSFFNDIYEGDAGTEWTPTFVGLTISGTPQFQGRYYRINQNIVFFTARITPATNTSSVAETTYIDNFPLSFLDDGICFAVRGGAGTNSGHIISANNRIYTPAWLTVTTPITVVGLGVAR
jgi:hypothetical protein